MDKANKKRRAFWTMERRSGLVGILFISPFILGFLLLFLIPAIESIRRSFSSFEFIDGREVLTSVGFANYQRIFTVDPDFPQFLANYFIRMIPQLIIVLIFSMFIALLL